MDDIIYYFTGHNLVLTTSDFNEILEDIESEVGQGKNIRLMFSLNPISN